MRKFGALVVALWAYCSCGVVWSQQNPPLDPILDRAIDLMKAGKTDQATVTFKAAAQAAKERKDQPTATEILLMLGQFQSQNEQFQDALDTFGEAFRQSAGTDLRATADAHLLLMLTRAKLAQLEGLPQNSVIAYDLLASNELKLSKIPKKWRTSLESEFLTLRIYAYMGFCDKFAAELAKARSAEELPPAMQVFLTAALREMPLEAIDPARLQRQTSLPAKDLAALNQQRPWMTSLRKIALKLNERVTELDRKRGPKYAMEVAKDLSQRADLRAQLGDLKEAIRLKKTAIEAFDKANLFTDSVMAKDRLVDLYLKDEGGAIEAFKVSIDLIDHIESQTFAFSGQSVGSLMARYRDAYNRHLTLLRAQLEFVRERQPKDLDRAYEQVLIHADRRNFRAPRRDIALYAEVGERLGADPEFRQHLEKLRVQVASRQNKVEEAREQGKTTADFTPLPGLQMNNPFTGLAAAKEELLAAFEDYKRRFVGVDKNKRQRLPSTLGDVRAGMGPDDAIVMYYQEGEDADSLCAAIITTSPTTRRVELPGTDDKNVAQLLERMREEVITQFESSDSASGKLAQLLWRPLGELPKHLTIVLTPRLIGLPFESLPTEDGERVAQQHNVRYALGLADGLGRRHSASALRAALVAGAESFVNPALDTLPASREEIDGLRIALGAKCHVVMPRDAFPWAARPVFSEAGNFGFLHISTHSVLDRKAPMFDALAFPQDELFAYDLALSPLRADLAVLSACELFTARPDRFYPVSGLTTALLARVAPQVISTLWPVNAGATKLFMLRFYDRLLSQQDAATALAGTKCDFIEPARLEQWMVASGIQASPGVAVRAFASTYFWAGFVLVVRSGAPANAEPSPSEPNRSAELPKLAAPLRLGYDRLSPDDRTRFHALGVFSGSFDKSAAAAVLQADNEGTEQILQTLQAASFVTWERESGVFQLGDLIRDFARSRLSAEEDCLLRLRHAVYYKNVLEVAERLYLRGGQEVLRGLTLFDRNRENIEAGQQWAVQHAASLPEASRLVPDYPAAGPNIINLRLLPRDHVRWLTAAVDECRKLGDRSSECHALLHLGNGCLALGELHLAIKHYELSLDLAREIGDRRAEAKALGNLANTEAVLGETSKAVRYYEQDLAIVRELGDRLREGTVLGNLGTAYALSGETSKGIEHLEMALAIAREFGDRWGEEIVLGGLGQAYTKLGQTLKAIDHFGQQLAIAREIGDRKNLSAVLSNLGIAYSTLGETRRAIEHFEQCLAILRGNDERNAEGHMLYNIAVEYVKVGDFSRAITLGEESVRIFKALEDPFVETVQVSVAGWLSKKRGE